MSVLWKTKKMSCQPQKLVPVGDLLVITDVDENLQLLFLFAAWWAPCIRWPRPVPSDRAMRQ